VSDKNYQLVVRKGPKSGQVFDLIADVMTLGRDAVADIVIVDPEVSRQHLQFKQTDDGHRLQDLGSTNGTFVNGRRLSGEWVDLVPGQEIMLGSSIVLLYREADEDFVLPTLAPDDDEETGDPDETDDEEWALADTEAADIEAIFEDEDEEDDDDDLAHLFAEPDPITTETDREPDPAAPTPPPLPPERPAAGDVQRTGPLVPTSKGRGKGRRNTILLITILFVILCCCALTLFMWYWGGDWLLQQWGVIP
jgi:pSer/pThr/pTyr-binding forkhead associated (FHA) protein